MSGPFQFSSGRNPIHIQSDTMSLDNKTNSVLFSGHVHAIQANGRLSADRLRVDYGQGFHDVREIIADGNVRISQGTRWATGDHAVMNQTKHTAVLTGSPVVHDGSDEITGDKITVYLDTGKSVVEHARAVIFPRSSQSAQNEDSNAAAH
jgi:lipopolysaccharide export system protein LptA